MPTDRILQHYQGYEELIRRLEESIKRFEKTGVNIAFGFLGIDAQKVAVSYLADQVPYKLIGGYDEAIKKRLVIGEDIDETDFVSCLKASYNTKFNNLTHRDLLGSVYALGFEIEKFGDMWVRDGQMYLYCVNEISAYIIENLTRVGHCNTHFNEIEYAAQQFEFETYHTVCSSLRLDSIVSSVIRKSREKAKEMIVSGRVNVNYKTIEECDFVCNNNDILSIRLIGRFQIDNIDRNPRSGKYLLSIKKFK